MDQDAPADDVNAILRPDRHAVLAALGSAGLDIRSFYGASTTHAVRYLLTVWLAFAALLVAWAWLPGWWGIALVPAVGILQHAFLNIVHEASHHSLLADRAWNDRVGNLLAALPIGHTVASYRLTHVDHHNHLRTARDPSSYVTDPALTRAQIRRTLLQLLLGRLAAELLTRTIAGRRFRAAASGDRAATQSTDRQRLLGVALYQPVLFLACWAAGAAGFWLLWLAVLVTVTPTLDGLRTIVEHRRLAGDAATDGARFHTRSHHRHLVTSGLMAPYFQYHWEHHLFPGIPHHGLAALHRQLLALRLPAAAPAPGGFFGSLLPLI